MTRRQGIVALVGCRDDRRKGQSVLVPCPSSLFFPVPSELVRWLAMVVAVLALVLIGRLLMFALDPSAVFGYPWMVLVVDSVCHPRLWLGLVLLASRLAFAFSTLLARAF